LCRAARFCGRTARSVASDVWKATPELQLENSRLRRLVTDLLLEKIKVEEAAQIKSSA
jgi:hypothetical protein